MKFPAINLSIFFLLWDEIPVHIKELRALNWDCCVSEIGLQILYPCLCNLHPALQLLLLIWQTSILLIWQHLNVQTKIRHGKVQNLNAGYNTYFWWNEQKSWQKLWSKEIAKKSNDQKKEDPFIVEMITNHTVYTCLWLYAIYLHSWIETV